MGEIKQLTKEDVSEIIKDFPIVPQFRRLIISLNMLEDDGIVLSEDGLSETQYIIATDPESKFKPGDKVIIDFKKLLVKVPSEVDSTQYITKIEVDQILVDDVVYAFVEERVIKAIDNR